MGVSTRRFILDFLRGKSSQNSSSSGQYIFSRGDPIMGPREFGNVLVNYTLEI